MLALPKKWVKEMELSSGDEVTVKINEESALNISPLKKNKNNKKEEATIETSLTDNDGNIVRKLISTYVLGYNIINIKAKEGKLSSKQRDTIKIIVRGSLIGAEVISDSLDMITIQVLISFTELNVENAIKRMFLIANSMQKDSIESLNKLDKDAVRDYLKANPESTEIPEEIQNKVIDSYLDLYGRFTGIQVSNNDMLNMPDNIAVSPWGDLIICEDNGDVNNTYM